MTLGQAAMLAGMLKAPSRYNPRIDPTAPRARASVVLDDDGRGRLHHRRAMRRQASTAPGLADARRRGSGRYFADWVLDDRRELVGDADPMLSVDATIDRACRQRRGALEALLAAPRRPEPASAGR